VTFSRNNTRAAKKDRKRKNTSTNSYATNSGDACNENAKPIETRSKSIISEPLAKCELSVHTYDDGTTVVLRVGLEIVFTFGVF